MTFSATKIVLIMLVTAIIVLNFLGIQVEEPLKTVTLMVVSFYFGQKITGVSDTSASLSNSGVTQSATQQETSI